MKRVMEAMGRNGVWRLARVAAVCAGGVVVLACYAAFHKLGYRSMWYDEIRTVQVYAARPFDVRHGDPPLYSLYVRVVSRWTQHEFWLRLPNALGIVGLAAVLVYGWRRWMSPLAGGLAGLAAATSVALLTCGKMTRPYGLSTGALALAYMAFVRMLETARWRWLGVYVAAAVVVLYTQYSGIIMCGVHAAAGLVWVLAHHGRRGRAVGMGVAAATCAGALVLPWYVQVYRGLAGLLASTPAPRQAMSFAAFAAYVSRELFIGVPPVLVGLLIVAGAALSAVRRHWFAALLAMAWLLAGLVLVYWHSTTHGMFLAARYYLFFLPPAYLLAACGVVELAQIVTWVVAPPIRRAAGSALALVGWLAVWWASLVAWQTYQVYHRNTDSRQVAELSRHCAARGIPAFYNGWHLAFSHYAHALQRGDPLAALATTEPVLYVTDQPYEVLVSAPFVQCDTVHLPYEATPQVYALFRGRTSLTNYVQRSMSVLREAVALDPRHRQMREQLERFETFAGRRAVARPPRLQASAQGAAELPARAWRAQWGWGGLERRNDGTAFRWSVGRVAYVCMAIDRAAVRGVRLHAYAFTPRPDGHQSITAWLGGVCLGVRQVSSAGAQLAWELPRLAAPGTHVLAFDISHPCPPAAVGAGSDSRALGIAASSIIFETVPPLAAPRIDLGSGSDTPWLDHAWSHVETWAGIGTFRWITNTAARVFWHEHAPRGQAVWRLQVLPFAPAGQAQQMRVMQDGIVLTNIVLAPKWADYDVVSPGLRHALTEVKLEFSYTATPAAAGIGGDTRPLAAAVARLERLPRAPGR